MSGLASVHGVNPTPQSLSDLLAASGRLNEQLTKARGDAAQTRTDLAAILAKHKAREPAMRAMLDDPTYTFGEGSKLLPGPPTKKEPTVPLPSSPDSLYASSMTLDGPTHLSPDSHASGDEDDLIVETLTKVAKQKGFNMKEAGFLLHVLNVDPKKWLGYPGFEKREDAEITAAEVRDAEKYGNDHNWSLGKAEFNESQDLFRKYAIILLWARGFAAGLYNDTFNKTTADAVLRGKPTDLIPSTYRDKFLELYGPKSPDPMEVLLNLYDPKSPDPMDVIRANDMLISKIDEGDEGGSPDSTVAAIAFMVLLLGMLLYFTQR